jgi:hypothetical protein
MLGLEDSVIAGQGYRLHNESCGSGYDIAVKKMPIFAVRRAISKSAYQ